MSTGHPRCPHAQVPTCAGPGLRIAWAAGLVSRMCECGCFRVGRSASPRFRETTEGGKSGETSTLVSWGRQKVHPQSHSHGPATPDPHCDTETLLASSSGLASSPNAHHDLLWRSGLPEPKKPEAGKHQGKVSMPVRERNGLQSVKLSRMVYPQPDGLTPSRKDVLVMTPWMAPIIWEGTVNTDIVNEQFQL